MRRMMMLFVSAVLLCSLVLLGGCSSDGGSSGDGASESAESVELTLLIREAQPSVAESFEEGQPVRVKDTGTLLGEIVEVDIQDALQAVPTSEGELNAARTPVLVDVELTIRGDAVVSDAGYRFGGEYVYINNDIKYLTPLTQFGGIVLDMTPVDE